MDQHSLLLGSLASRTSTECANFGSRYTRKQAKAPVSKSDRKWK